MYPGRLDAAMLKRLGLEEQVLDGLVADRVIALEARRLGITVDDEAVAREIATAPEYQRDGHFIGTAEIRRVLELRGMTVEEFENAVRGNLLRKKLGALVASGVSVSPGEVEREFRRRTEQLKAEYVLVEAARFRPQVVGERRRPRGALRGAKGALQDSRASGTFLRARRWRGTAQPRQRDRSRTRSGL